MSAERVAFEAAMMEDWSSLPETPDNVALILHQMRWEVRTYNGGRWP